MQISLVSPDTERNIVQEVPICGGMTCLLHGASARKNLDHATVVFYEHVDTDHAGRAVGKSRYRYQAYPPCSITKSVGAEIFFAASAALLPKPSRLRTRTQKNRRGLVSIPLAIQIFIGASRRKEMSSSLSRLCAIYHRIEDIDYIQ